LQTVEDRIKQLEDKPNAAEEVKKLAATVEKQRTDYHELRDCVQDAVRDKLQEDKEEADDLQRRSMNIIIHGLKETPEEDREARRIGETDQVQGMLHVMKCDDVSVQNMVRLGSYETSLEKLTPRPLKVVMASERQRKKVLSQAKNLKEYRNFEKVYIQQDFTKKQREKREELVQQLIQRKALG